MAGRAPIDAPSELLTGSPRLRPVVFTLERVLSVAHRMGETQAAALARQKEADNLVTVLPGDEIRGLPTYNAAEAAGRMPDVGIERDEGEGKFVQIRGTEPRLSNVTIDGVHVPGSVSGRAHHSNRSSGSSSGVMSRSATGSVLLIAGRRPPWGICDPDRYRGFYGAAKAAERSGDRQTARAFYEKLVALCSHADTERPGLVEAKTYLAQN